MKVCSIFSQVLKLFSRGDFERAVKQHRPNGTRGVSPVGVSSWRCCFARWEGRIRCARFAAVWRVAKGN